MEGQSLLSPLRGADGVRAALRSTALRTTVRTALAGMLEDPTALGPCRLHRTKFKPGAKLTASFHTALRGQPGREVAISWWPPGACPAPSTEERAAEADALARGTAQPFVTLTLDAPTGMRVHVAPLDPAFPGLAAMSDAAHASARLGLGGQPEVLALRYRPGQRHVLRYRSQGRTLFAKLYRDDRGRRHADAAAALGRVVPAGTAVAQPSTYLPEEQAVVFAETSGAPLSSILRTRPDAAGAALEGTGHALRSIHEGPVVDESAPRTADDEAAEVRRAAATITALTPQRGAVVDDVISGVREALAALPIEESRLCHGDFKGDHVLVGPDTLTLIDVDKCGRADPALDLAKFLADLRWWLAADAVDGAQRRFLDGYGSAPAARLARARALEPLFMVKLAARRIQVHQPDWDLRTAAAVDHADHLLHDLSRA